jgi:hypothetical protein
MGIWRFAGAFAVVERQSECGSKDRRNARQPANAHRRVLGAGDLIFNLSINKFNLQSISLCA